MPHTLIDKLQSNVQGDEFYLLKVAVGPVQEFISEARKTRDLYMGSLLLSQITLESMKPICDAYGPEAIIYPYMGDSSSNSVSIPNMYMAVIPKNDLNFTIKEMECHILGLWNNVVKEVSKKLPSGCTKEYEHWMKQIGNHFYMNWVAVSITSEELEKSYISKVQDIQHFLDERKMTRTFDAWEGKNTPKCVQCAHREAMSGNFFSKLRMKKEFKMKIKENEILCGVCLLKRLVKTKNVNINLTDPGFESVVDVSAGTFKQLINRNKTQKVVQEFLEDVNKIKKSFLEEKIVDEIEELSGEWYYKDNLSIEFLQKEYGVDKYKLPELSAKSAKAQKTLDQVYELVKRTPSKYYAIVNMDGDDMGKVMSGESLDDNTFTVDYHNTLSKTLATTAATASDLIKYEGDGLCVYSGGDDLLAFLPIEKFLPTINEARFSFSKEFKLIDEALTSSAGIVLLHYHDPLRRGLKEANDNVEKAKELFRQKDAFFITLRIFSGTVITWGSQWTIKTTEIIDEIQVLNIVKTFVSFMTRDSKNRLSSNFVRDLMKELHVFYEWNEYKLKWSFKREMFKAEFKRLLKRHIPLKSDLWGPENVKLLKLTEIFFAHMADPDKNKQIHDTDDFTKDNFEHFLQISLFLAKELTGNCD